MTKFCEACHTANKDSAKYCSGCKGRFSGVRFAANTVAAEFADSREASSAMYLPPWRPEPGTGLFGRKGLWVLILLVSAGAFAYWYSSRPEGAPWTFGSLTSLFGRGTATPSEGARPVVVFERRTSSKRSADGTVPTDASTLVVPALETGAAPPKPKVCTEAHFALGLCKKN